MSRPIAKIPERLYSDVFRHRSNRASISLRECFVALIGGLTLAFTAWGLGGITTWSLHALFGGGLATLVFALLPFPSNLRSPLSTLHFPFQSLKRLAAWPFFWFSLAFLLYLLIGALNPAAQVVSDERGWWVEAIHPKLAVWMPTSIVSDYQQMNAWRVLVSFTASFALVCGLWAGLTRRASVLFVLWCLLLSGASMGLVAILQHLSEAEAVLWNFPSSNENFWGSFFYRNQAAAYLNLMLVLAGVLFFYHGVKTRENMRSGGPHFLCLMLFALTAVSVGLALSRGGIFFAGLLSLSFLALLVVFLLKGIGHISSLWSVCIPFVLLAIGSVIFVRYIDLEAIEQRFSDIEATIETADQDARALSSSATWDMAQARLVQGWGAGSFRYIFPMFQREYPQIFYARYHSRKGEWSGRRVYRYAHNDILQFLAEYGAVGCSLLSLAFISLIASILKNTLHFPLSTFYLLVGIATIIAHALLDFIFNSPAYWMAFVGLLAVTAKLLHLEAKKKERRKLKLHALSSSNRGAK